MVEKRKIVDSLRNECVKYINSISLDLRTMRHLLTLIESKDMSRISRFLFYTLFQSKGGQFYDLLEKSRTPIYKLVESIDGDIQIFDFHYLCHVV